ncbi:hypothetical protein ESA94_18970 [Lacibacter luteus]|uniref:Uncharacterized protein n=1 Tax=Lacibacter luteus TaxID=2508719 RepID=A0A4Q1CEE4_9BACT|nr:hypothetical protein [Lacibacter luteus]RXK58096.1 hypothetical protein ESA94_18970 [Lacibacter luteus]
MKISKISFRLGAILFVSSVLFACKKKNDVPANEITESSALEIYTSWSLTDNSSATVGADIDVLLVKGNITSESQLAALPISDLIDYSDNDSDFETMNLPSSLADGDYSVILDYYDIQKAGKYTIRFKGTASGKIYSFADVAFAVAEDGSTKFPVRITKSGQKFTVSPR